MERTNKKPCCQITEKNIFIEKITKYNEPIEYICKTIPTLQNKALKVELTKNARYSTLTLYRGNFIRTFSEIFITSSSTINREYPFSLHWMSDFQSTWRSFKKID